MSRKKLSREIGGELVAVMEVTVAELPEFSRLCKAFLAGEGRDPVAELLEFVQEHTPALVDLLAACTSLGEEVRRCGASDMVELVKAFMEVNAGFFGGVTGLMGLAGTGLGAVASPPPSPETSATGSPTPSTTSSGAATPGSSSTA